MMHQKLAQILLDNMPCVTLILKPYTREIVASNKAARDIGALRGKTCYSTWAKRKNPCPWCLAEKLWKTNEPQHIEVESKGIVWDAYWVPVSKDLYLHYAFDITERRMAEDALKGSIKELRAKENQLNEKNIALKEVISQVEIEKRQVVENVKANVERLILPLVQKLKKTYSRKYMVLLEQSVGSLVSGFGRNISDRLLSLSPREIEVCSAIKNGMSSKEISGLLHLSVQTVERHRKNIRRKLKITDKKINLSFFLHQMV